MSSGFTEYAGMYAGELAVWVLLGGLAGFLARAILGGPKPFGLYGDLILATVGAFVLGNILRRFDIDISSMLAPYLSGGIPLEAAIWGDIFIVGFIGALILRIPLRIVGGRG
jgi:uncharacterized membrane protein YeaQ/YmgE (transglycosylase-associated protein family)